MDSLGFKVPFQDAAEGMVVVNSEGLIEQANRAIEKLFGYKEEEILGKPIELLIPIETRIAHEKLRSDFMNSPVARSMGKGMELYGLRKSGNQFPVEISLSHFYYRENLYVLAFVVDISLQKRIYENLRQSHAQLENEVEKRTVVLRKTVTDLELTRTELKEALAKEKKLSDLKSRFISLVSHEFRTPLAVILSSADLLDKQIAQQQSEKTGKYIEQIRNTVRALTEMMNEVLSIGRLEEGKIVQSPTEFNIREFFEEMLQDMSSLVKVGQEIRLVSAGTTRDVYFDKGILRHIVINLVSNAIKFSPINSFIEIETKAANKWLMISVKDYGIGIPQKDQEHLFESFFRAENAVATPGTGLGLNIVAQYVQVLGGAIDVKSRENEGTTFVITLPVPSRSQGAS